MENYCFLICRIKIYIIETYLQCPFSNLLITRESKKYCYLYLNLLACFSTKAHICRLTTIMNASATKEVMFFTNLTVNGCPTIKLSINDFMSSIPTNVAAIATIAVRHTCNDLCLIFFIDFNAIPTISPIAILPTDQPGIPLKPKPPIIQYEITPREPMIAPSCHSKRQIYTVITIYPRHGHVMPSLSLSMLCVSVSAI